MNNEMLSAQAVVKWFNPFKGYGFVNVKGIMEDVFLHFSSLHQHEINVVKPGDVLLCDISFSKEKRYYVACVKEYQSTANDIEKAEYCTATVKWFNPFKGYGFAMDEHGNDIIIHASVLKKSGLKKLSTGMTIQTISAKTHKGYEAKAIIKTKDLKH